MIGNRLLNRLSRTLFLWLLLLNWGCVHRIHVTPTPPVIAPTPIAQSVQVIVPFLAIEGADHMPGIALFDWPAEDLRSATMNYVQSRRTFTSVLDKTADQTLRIKAWLTMRSRGHYRYSLRLESDLGPLDKPPVKSYLVEKEAIGSNVRWTTASDQAPIAETVQAALDDLLTQVEADRLLYQKGPR